MRKLGWVVVAAVLAAVVAGTVLYGQEAGGGGAWGGRGGQGQGGGGFAYDPARMKMQLELLGLKDQEVTAALKCGETKGKARQALDEQRGKLRAQADDLRATDQQLAQGIASYTATMAQYRKTVQTEDGTLSKKLSVRSRAQCLAAGILDNGLGGGGGRPRGGGGPGGGGGGRRGGGGDFGGGAPE